MLTEGTPPVPDALDQILNRGDIALSPPASQADIDELARICGGSLPESLVGLWRTADGADLGPLDADLLGVTEILLMRQDPEWLGSPAGLGFVPILRLNLSDCIGVWLVGPLAPRVASIPHDNDWRLLYHDCDGLFRALLAAFDREAPDDAFDFNDSADTYFREVRGEFEPATPRTEEDHAAARSLLARAAADPESDRSSTYRLLAAQLLDASCLDDWAALLETGHFVRREILARLRRSDDPAIRELLARDQRRFDDFAAQVVEAAHAAGIGVGERDDNSLRLDGRWKLLDGFFYRRQIPDAMPRLITWFQDQAAGRNPHDRPGHFMAD